MPGNGEIQNKAGYKFVADNTDEVMPFDWYNARLDIDFRVDKTVDGSAIGAEDHNGIVNGSHSLIRGLKIEANGISVYDCKRANQAVNIKNLLEYSTQYVKCAGSTQLFFLDTNRNNEERNTTATKDTYNIGFAARKKLLGASKNVNVEIPLNRYSFFESLDNELLPNMKVGIEIDLESDNDFIWGVGGCRVVVTKLQLIVPRITFTSKGLEEYTKVYLKPRNWKYNMEVIHSSYSSQQQTGTFNITSGIHKPRDVFVWITNDARKNKQTENPFLFDTFSVAGDPRVLISCQLDVANGNLYPQVKYQPSTKPVRVFRDVRKYTYTDNGYQEGNLLNQGNFSTIFPFIYFDLRNQEEDIKDGTTKISFEYELDGETDAGYTAHALVLHEKEVNLDIASGKLTFRT